MPTDTPYTSGDWHVKAENLEAFLESWTALAESSMGRGGGLGFTLIRDVADPLHFVSFGRWRDSSALTMSRSRETFVELFKRCQSLCDRYRGADFRLEVAVEDGDGAATG
jgi:quinol monooxygenase YgiN